MPVTVKQLRTSIPGWYDTEYLESNGIEPEAGAYIRSRVPVTTKKISDQLRAEEERIKRAFAASPDLRIFAIPQLETASKLDVDLSKATGDEEQVNTYIASTLPGAARYTAAQVGAYMVGVLKKTRLRSPNARQVRFLYATGEQVLTYKTIKVDYRRQGLVLLKGVNKDWPRQSNGAGKSNALSLLPIALFGETLKEQKHDQWAREGSKKAAVCELAAKVDGKDLVKIVRGRRPHSVKLTVGDKDLSTGLTGKEKTGTQGKIEEVTGFDFRMLLNSVYIDQTVANGFVFGIQSERMKLVNKLCNLERYEAALKIVGEDIKNNDRHLQEESAREEQLDEDIRRIQEELQEVEAHTETKWERAKRAALGQVARMEKEAKALLSEAASYQNKEDSMKSKKLEYDQAFQLLRDTEKAVYHTQKQVTELQELYDAGKCSKCGQATQKITKSPLENAKVFLASAVLDQKRDRAVVERLFQIADRLGNELRGYKDAVGSNAKDLANARQLLQQAEDGARGEEERNKRYEIQRVKGAEELRNLRRALRACKDRQEHLSVDRELLEYAKAAFHRSGMPLYLAASLCPVLNAAAEEYSEIFFDGKTKVRFEVVDGEFQPSIINPSGSRTRRGQSDGETSMAGIVAAFALREAAPKTNLLMVDEPGDGLDEVAARQFARGLIKIKDRFETIILTTHSSTISSELEGECTVWTAVKEKGVSRLITSA